VWSWASWRYDPVNGILVHAEDRGLLIPYNYFVLSVSRYQGS
jgi:hypothetical protein